MGFTIGTDQKNIIPLYLRFRYNGTDVAWTQPYRINNFSNSAESVDGKYRISDLDVYFIDPRGSYFATQFGNGTLGFGTSLEMIAYLGGTMESVTQGNLSIYKRVGTVGAFTATIHTGKIHGISYSNQLLRVRSKNKMALLSELKWQFPISKETVQAGTIYGSNYFFASNLRTTYLGTTAFYDYSNKRDKWRMNAYILGTDYTAATNLPAAYPVMAGRGTVSTHGSFYFAGTDASGTNFYQVNEMVELEGTFYGAYVGTIDSTEDAQEFGFKNLSESEAAIHETASGTYYTINRTRIKISGTSTGSYFTFVSPLTLDGSPKDVYQLMMTGAMVTPYFTTADLDSSTLAQSALTTAYSYFKQTIDYKEDAVVDNIKNVITCTQALFSVNTSNKFELLCYGPKNLNTSIPSYGTQDIINSGFENLEEDYFNRFVIKYNWDYINRRFNAQKEAKTDNWTRVSDNPLVVEAKWVSNPNEASILAQRMKLRYNYTIPRINFKTNLNKMGLGLGSLVQITDPNSGLSSKVVQVVSTDQSWEDKTIEWSGFDGESLYARRGYAFWDDGTVLPGVTVSGTSTAGWGTLGTTANINGTIYGSMFAWF